MMGGTSTDDGHKIGGSSRGGDKSLGIEGNACVDGYNG